MPNFSLFPMAGNGVGESSTRSESGQRRDRAHSGAVAPSIRMRCMRRLACAFAALLGAACAASPRPEPASVAPPVTAPRCGTDPEGARGALALHGYWSQQATPVAAPGLDRDENHVAILHDRGDIIVRRNLFDLAGAAVRFSPNSAGGYDPARLALALEAPGTSLNLPTGAARAVDLPFGFPFFGGVYDRVFVNADGNLTFGVGDTDVGEKGLARFLAGPPRIAPFFTDLDPSRGGSVSAQLQGDRAVFLWNGVPGGGQVNRNSFEVVLHSGGAIDVVYGTEVQTREAVVGVAPGGTLTVTASDLSGGRPVGSPGALAERFSESEKVDLVSVSRRFLAGHPDVFEQLVTYTTRPLNPIPGTLAFELNIRNDIQGIGLEAGLDQSAQWGSGGVLASVAYMDSIDQYLEVDGFEILAHEVGHRWLARLRFRDAAGRRSDALLGRALVHWSFFMNTEASVLEGSEIADRGGGRFETVDITRRFSALDQYAMGLRLPDEVPPFFYVDGPDNFRPNRAFKFSSAPEAGISFTGIRRDVRIEDVIAAMGPRVPDASRAPRRLRQAFILVADEEAPATDARRQALARIRTRFEPYYREATGERGAVDATLP